MIRAELDRLDGQWRRLGVRVEDVLEPGLAGSVASESLMSEFGVAPQQLVDWFSWHNGSRDQVWRVAPLAYFPLLSLDEAIQARKTALAVEPDDDDELPVFRSTWLPIASAGVIMFAVDIVDDVLVSIDYYDPAFATVVSSDLAAAATVWADVLEAGHYRWTGAAWEYSYADIPLELRPVGLVG